MSTPRSSIGQRSAHTPSSQTLGQHRGGMGLAAAHERRTCGLAAKSERAKAACHPGQIVKARKLGLHPCSHYSVCVRPSLDANGARNGMHCNYLHTFLQTVAGFDKSCARP